ncbi:MAG TPA: response regulator [Candidatus Paceibacterota bacterium]|nr:response regulator [Candidatus Paceibacterota bacterium]
MDKYSILFADDDEFIRKIYGDRFKAAGFDVVMADSVEATERALETGSFDLICIDYLFANKTGLDLLKWIREEKKITLPVIVFSASGQDAEIKKFMDAGATEYIQKDQTKPSEFIEKIKQIIQSHKQHA